MTRTTERPLPVDCWKPTNILLVHSLTYHSRGVGLPFEFRLRSARFGINSSVTSKYLTLSESYLNAAKTKTEFINMSKCQRRSATREFMQNSRQREICKKSISLTVILCGQFKTRGPGMQHRFMTIYEKCINIELFTAFTSCATPLVSPLCPQTKQLLPN